MRHYLIGSALISAALCAQIAVWPAQATQPPHAAAPAQPFALVKDINTTPQPRSSMDNSQIFGTINNTILFRAYTQQTGSELWASDGTAAGTRLVKDIRPGEDWSLNYYYGGEKPAIVNRRVLFAANDGVHGNELWASDGTTAGTRLVRDIRLGAENSNPYNFVVSGNRAFFTSPITETGLALWISDGTPDGTTPLRTFANIDGNLMLVGRTLFFSAADSGGDQELWKSDGTPAGTVLVKDIAPNGASSFPRELFAYGAGEVWFSASDGVHKRELWRSDGTPGGTQRFAQADAGPAIFEPSQLVALPSASQPDNAAKILFRADDGAHGQELWASDGTYANTTMLKDVNPNGSASPRFLGFGASQLGAGRAFYAMDDGVSGSELWATDGTFTNTMMLADIYTGTTSSDLGQTTTIGNLSFFAATSATAGRELWKSDGTADGTAQVTDIYSGTKGGDPRDLTAFKGKLYFSADDGIHGRELWKSDGTTTTLVKDIQPGSAPGVRQVLGAAFGALYFTAADGTTGVELWKSDGTPGGTQLVKNIAPDDGGIYLYQGYNVSAVGDRLMFGVDLAANGEALVSSAAARTAVQSRQSILAPAKAVGEEASAVLWQSDGTAAGTTLVRSFPDPQHDGAPYNLTALGDSVLFAGLDSPSVTELWRSDGTPAGTSILTNTVRPYFGYPADLTRLNGMVLFDVYTGTLADDSWNQTSLWKSDGTPQGTQLITTNVSLGYYSYAVSGNTLFFAHSPQENGSNVELWKTDGSAAGTTLVSDIASGDSGSYPRSITPGQPGEVFFLARMDTSGYALWKSDGTPQGTQLVHGLPMIGNQMAYGELAYSGGTLFFTANDGIHGWELWASDGTSQGTGLVADIYPGPGSSQPENLIGLNGMIYFAATDPDGTRTLWRSDGTGQGTRPLRSDASAPQQPYHLELVQGQLLFSAADDAHGRELWRSDGTEAGTTLLQDIVPGPDSSNPNAVSAAGKQVYFTADTPGVGRELWALAPAVSNTSTPTPTLPAGQPTPTLPAGQPTPNPTGLPAPSEWRVYVPLTQR